MEWFDQLGMIGVIDILLMSVLIYACLCWFKRTGAAPVLTGIIMVAGLYLVIRYFNLSMTAAVLEKFFAVILIVMIVIFQEELRNFFERIATLWSFRDRNNGKPSRLTREEVEVLSRTLVDLAREKIGALIVLQGRDLLARHLKGGNDLDGRLSEPLLKSIFDPNSAGHDGAVVVSGSRVTEFGCHLPLSKNLGKLGKGGTRHAAALGLSEVTDVLCLVVSEERGTISRARTGQIRVIEDADALIRLLEEFYREVHPKKAGARWSEVLRENSREKVVAVLLALGLWFVLFHASQMTSRSVAVRIHHQALPSPWKVEKVDPDEVDVLLRGPRRAFFLLRPEKCGATVRARLREGSQNITLMPDDFSFPDDLAVERVEPQRVKVEVTREPSP